MAPNGRNPSAVADAAALGFRRLRGLKEGGSGPAGGLVELDQGVFELAFAHQRDVAFVSKAGSVGVGQSYE